MLVAEKLGEAGECCASGAHLGVRYIWPPACTSGFGGYLGSLLMIPLPRLLDRAGIQMLKETCNVETAYNMTPEQLCAKVSLADALIVRSGTKVRCGAGRAVTAAPRAASVCAPLVQPRFAHSAPDAQWA